MAGATDQPYPVVDGHDSCAVGANGEPAGVVEALGDQGGREGHGIEVGLEAGEAGFGNGRAGELELGGVLEVACEAYAEDAEEGLAAVLLVVLAGVGIAGGCVPWDGLDVGEIDRTEG